MSLSSQLSVSDIVCLVITLNVLLLLTDEFGDVLTCLGSQLYYIHYAILAGYILYDTIQQGKIEHRTLWIGILGISGCLLGLIGYYEHITDYSMSDQTDEMIAVIRIFFIGVLGLLVLIPVLIPHSARSKVVIYPVFLLYFLIASQQQRSYFLLVFIPILEVLASLASTQDSYYLYCLLVTQGSLSYLTNRGSFGFDISLRAGNHSWGLYPDEYPVFTGLIFAFHKMAWYHMCGAYLYRCLPYPLSTKGMQFMLFLVCRGLVVLLVFMLGFYANPANTLSVFMWAMAQCSTMLFAHPFHIFSNLTQAKSA